MIKNDFCRDRSAGKRLIQPINFACTELQYCDELGIMEMPSDNRYTVSSVEKQGTSPEDAIMRS